jgi:pyridoxal phosphate enzyme (YggS family)|tara:strand:- start:75 stop:746 length:672 start_codon:yes stop_codon:yes gene_type:complete
MHFIEKNLNIVKERIERTSNKFGRDPNDIKLIVITKKFDKESIKPLVDCGQVLFGENKVQEAKNKWSEVISMNKNIKLHMVGGLQSNKIKDALSIFSCIHSVDRIKILEHINKYLNEDSLLEEFFIQVNISKEVSKGGVDLQSLESFLKEAKTFNDIKMLGLMTMPPAMEEPSVYFALLNKLAEKENLKYLSMGMSNDYETAIALGATHIRVGEAIMGPRAKS